MFSSQKEENRDTFTIIHLPVKLILYKENNSDKIKFSLKRQASYLDS